MNLLQAQEIDHNNNNDLSKTTVEKVSMANYYQQKANQGLAAGLIKAISWIPRIVEEVLKKVITLGKTVVTQFFG